MCWSITQTLTNPEHRFLFFGACGDASVWIDVDVLPKEPFHGKFGWRL
jgi:hypothetical protein